MFTRMYEHRRYGHIPYDEPIAGISAMYTIDDHEYKFGNREGRVFHLRHGDGTLMLSEILDQMRSQLCATDPFYFVIDDGLVKAVAV